ncbi:DnaJ domain-containing protein [Cephalotus follicularis]|uniref:DnaJ domain-containing protein n=1 Tax=Cephalotus follicularis TaxID=3775 RepID=A0A1Q3CBK2_CEPFO|nr:DnaJ domain-containing protein [Cephalotus follicularis]
MQGDEAKVLLGFSPNSHPSPSQIKEAYKRKVWKSHPDLFPLHEKPLAESKFKLISEAYSYLLSVSSSTTTVSAARVVKTGVPKAHGHGGRISNPAIIRIPFLFIILGTLGLGGFNAVRAYQKEKHSHPSHNPFLP